MLIQNVLPPKAITVNAQLENYYGSTLYANYLENYDPIIKEYSKVVEDYKKNLDVPLEEPWFNIKEMYLDRNSNFGYALHDLNGNPALILMERKSPLENPTIIAIYTLVDGKPKLLESFGPRYRGYVGLGGFIYTDSSSGWYTSIYSKCKVKSDGTGLEAIETLEKCLGEEIPFGSDENYEPVLKYYKTIGNSEQIEINEQEFQKIYNKMSKEMCKRNPCLDFIPINFLKPAPQILPNTIGINSITAYDSNGNEMKKPLLNSQGATLSNILTASGKWEEIDESNYYKWSYVPTKYKICSSKTNNDFFIGTDGNNTLIQYAQAFKIERGNHKGGGTEWHNCIAPRSLISNIEAFFKHL